MDFENWIPQYIPKRQDKRAREKVYNIDWNEAFNTLISQGNWNSETLYHLIHTGNISVKKAELADDSVRLGGKYPKYYAARDNVLGLDEDEYSPNSKWLPTKPEHPTNKKYVDSVKAYMEDLFEEYTIKYSNGVTALGIYKTWEEFIKNHPTGKKGESYIVNDHVVVWDHQKNEWYDAGPIRGEKGDKGDTGYGFSSGGRVGSLAIKNSDLDYDVGFSSVSVNDLVLSKTSRTITVSGDSPQDPQDGDIWIKI